MKVPDQDGPTLFKAHLLVKSYDVSEDRKKKTVDYNDMFEKFTLFSG